MLTRGEVLPLFARPGRQSGDQAALEPNKHQHDRQSDDRRCGSVLQQSSVNLEFAALTRAGAKPNATVAAAIALTRSIAAHATHV